MADENEQQSACEAGRDEQHCKCRQRRAAAEAAAENASAAQQPAAHHCTCKHDGAAEAGEGEAHHCKCKHGVMLRKPVMSSPSTARASTMPKATPFPRNHTWAMWPILHR